MSQNKIITNFIRVKVNDLILTDKKLIKFFLDKFII